MRWIPCIAVISSLFVGSGLRAQAPSETPSSRAAELRREGDELGRQGRFREAEETYNQAGRLTRFDDNAAGRRAKVAAAMGSVVDGGVKALVDSALEMQSNNTDALYLNSTRDFIRVQTPTPKGLEAFQDPRMDRQLERELHLLKRLETHEAAGFMLAKRRYVPGDYPGGEDEAVFGYANYLWPSVNTVLLVPDVSLAKFYQGEALLRSGKPREAYQVFLGVLEIDPLNVEVHKSLARSAPSRELEDRMSAEAHRRQGLEYLARRAYSRAWMEFKEMEKVASRPEDADVSKALIFIAATGKGRTVEAREALEAHLGRTSSEGVWMRPILESFARRIPIDQALQLVPQAKAGEGCFLVGLLRHAEGKSADATSLFKKAKALDLDTKCIEMDLFARLTEDRSPP